MLRLPRLATRFAKDRWSADSLLATGVVQVEQFCGGFDGMIPLSIAGWGPLLRSLDQGDVPPADQGDKRKRAKKQAMFLDEKQLEKQVL